ncbi:MAG: cellulase family glycosylhydrolase [Chloroflexia bacterium]
MLTAAVPAGFLAACGGGASPTSPPPTETPEPSASASSAPTVTATKAASASAVASARPGTVTPGGTTGTTTPASTSARPSAGAQSTAFPMKTSGIGYGMNVWLPPAADADRALTLMTAAGFNWARQWISWESVEPAQGNFQWKILDDVVAAAERQKVKLNVILLRAPQWAAPNGGIPKDKTTFAKYAGAVAARYKGRVASYEIWNEQNMAGETGGTVNAAEYVALLKAAFPAIKAADPGAFVVYGGLTPTGVNNPAIAVDDAVYLKQTYAFNNGEIKQYFDVLGIHASGANNPPETYWPENPGPGPGFFDHASFYFRRAEDLRKVMEEAGDGQKQAWITEFGWTTKNQAKGYEYGEYVSEQQQAEYLVNAFKWAQDKWPWCGVMFLWNLNFSTVSPPSDEKYPWSVLNADYSPRPSYTALKEMPKK